MDANMTDAEILAIGKNQFLLMKMFSFLKKMIMSERNCRFIFVFLIISLSS